MYISILGRQPNIGIAELAALYGKAAVSPLSDGAVKVETELFEFDRLGGSKKAGKIVAEFHGSNWQNVSKEIVRHYSRLWSASDHKITLGISAYGFNVSERDIQQTGIILKSRLKKHSTSLRLIPNKTAAHNTAVSHHNKLGLSPNKVELLVVRANNGNVLVAESIGAQNISALAARDQARPKTDAFVGMLPPKLAKIMINLSGLASGRILDPFCGTGVVLQESLLLGYDAYGTDLSQKMIDYSTVNTEGIRNKYKIKGSRVIEHGDAMTHTWSQPIDSVVAETYLGQPFSAPPSPAKQSSVSKNCNHIISSFLKNIHPQLKPDTKLVLAIPAWRDNKGRFNHLQLTADLETMGYSESSLSTNHALLYYREDQVVAREILILQRK